MALRNVLRQRRRSFITICSMAIGFALLSISLSISEGSYNVIIKQFTENITGHIQIHTEHYLDRPSLNSKIKSPEKIVTIIEKNLDNPIVASRIKGGALAYGVKRVLPAAVIGVQVEREDKLSSLSRKVKKGLYFSNVAEENHYEALLGSKLANNLKIKVGDDLVLIATGADGSIANDLFQVKGIVGSLDSMEANNIYLSEGGAKRFFSIYNAAHEIVILLPNHNDIYSAKDTLIRSLQEQPKLAVNTWQEVEKQFYQSMVADKKGNNVTSFIIILMVAIGVLNTVLMSVLERMHEYGLLRAIGVRPSNIISLVLSESSLLATLSCFLGSAISLPVNYWFAIEGIELEHSIEVGGMAFNRIVGEVSAQGTIVPFIVVFFTTILVSIFPAIKAASVPPTEALERG